MIAIRFSRPPRERVVRPWPPAHINLTGLHGRVWCEDHHITRIRYRGGD